MKVSPKILTLILALAAGSAGAAGTVAGTAINNVATASFTDPTTNAAATPVNSNPVVTNVTAVPSFTITPNSTGPNTAPTTYAYTYVNVLPNSVQSFKYVVTNTGNTPAVVSLTTQTNTTNPLPGTVTVTYYSDAALTQAITATPAIAPDGTFDVYQKYTIPATPAIGAKYDVDPVGKAKYDAAYKPGDTLPTTAAAATTYTTVINAPGTNTELVDDNNYNQVTVYTTNITPPSTPLIPPAPGDKVVTPPTTTGTQPADPNNPVSPPGTPTVTSDPKSSGYDGPPADPTKPESSTNFGTSIVVSGNDLLAYTTNGQTQVTFTNNIRNGGTLSDDVRVFPTDTNKSPIGTNNGDGSFTVNVPADTTNNVPAYSYTVTFLNNNGTAATLVTGSDSKKYPVFTVAPGGDTQYKTKVTFPNPQGTSVTDPYQIPVTIGLSSGNKDLTVAPKADSSSTDTILPPGMFFGDVDAGKPVPGNIGPGNTAQIVIPKAGALAISSTVLPATDTATNATAVFPMLITNPGEYNDSFTLTKSSVTFKDAAGNDLTAVQVRYVYADGSAVPTNTNGDFITKVVAANSVANNSSLTVYAVVDVPDGAAATGGSTGKPNPTFTQIATGNYSGVSVTDSNDQIQVGVIGGITVEKTQSVNSAAYTKSAQDAKPKDTLSYQIVAKNTYNGSVANFKLKDSNSTAVTVGTVTTTTNAFTFTNFVSASVTLTGFATGATTYYSVDEGGSWVATAPTTGVTAKGIWVAVDNNAVPGVDATDTVPAGATITLTINTTVK